jgi:hypothetical protein
MCLGIQYAKLGYCGVINQDELRDNVLDASFKTTSQVFPSVSWQVLLLAPAGLTLSAVEAVIGLGQLAVRSCLKQDLREYSLSPSRCRRTHSDTKYHRPGT